MTSRNVARLVFLVVLVGSTIAFLMQISTGTVPRFEHLDKVVHFAAFFILALTFHRAFPIPIWAALLLLIGYGLVIEWVQDILPYRSSSVGDLIADAAGAVSYYTYVFVRFQWRKRAQKKSK